MTLQNITERSTDVVALAAVSSPLWLQEVSTTAQLLLPIAGLLWIGLQAWFLWKKNT